MPDALPTSSVGALNGERRSTFNEYLSRIIPEYRSYCIVLHSHLEWDSEDVIGDRFLLPLHESAH